ncbi:MAG: adenosylmethionine decarboxylase [Pseudomonadota bacterium]
MDFFEGSEKKVEIVLDEAAGDLRAKPEGFWRGIVDLSDASILSRLSNETCEAYLLSESSLFVWSDRLLMITCGRTRLARAAIGVIEAFGADALRSLIFQRKNEFVAHLQSTSFADDARAIGSLIPHTVYRFGDLDGHHTHLLHLDAPYAPDADDRTTEILMYHIEGPAADLLATPHQDRAAMRSAIRIERLEALGFLIDDFAFSPLGYSMNALAGGVYATLHVTPQGDASYVSFETNADLSGPMGALTDWLVGTFRPRSVDMMRFNAAATDLGPDMTPIIHNAAPNIAGYQVAFSHHARRLTGPSAPARLSDKDLL